MKPSKVTALPEMLAKMKARCMSHYMKTSLNMAAVKMAMKQVKVS